MRMTALFIPLWWVSVVVAVATLTNDPLLLTTPKGDCWEEHKAEESAAACMAHTLTIIECQFQGSCSVDHLLAPATGRECYMLGEAESRRREKAGALQAAFSCTVEEESNA